MPKTADQIDNIKKKLADFIPVMDGLSRARNPFELRYFVIGKHDDRVQQYKQAVIEMDAKYKAVEEAQAALELSALKKEELEIQIILKPANRTEEIENEKSLLEIARLEREEKQTRIAMTGAFKEVMDFITIIENEYSDLIEKTEEELLKTEESYWKARFSKQCFIDLMSFGRLSDGNRSSLAMLPQEIQEEILGSAMFRAESVKRMENRVANQTAIKLAESYPHPTPYLAPSNYVPLKLRKDAPDGFPADRIVEIDRAEIMVATLHRPNDNVSLSPAFWIPSGKNYIAHYLTCPNGESIGEYRNRIVKDALSLGCTHLFFVDDDLVVDQGALQKLFAHNLDVVGGWYCKKTPVPESATLISEANGSGSMRGVSLSTTGLVEVDWSLTAGLTLIKMDVFKRIPYPWYLTTEHGTEDTYLCARLREAGIKSFLDTSLKADHVDKSNGDAYTFGGLVKGKYKV